MGRAVFSRPVDTLFPYKALFAEKGSRYQWSIDPDNGLWIPVQIDGLGQHRGIDFDCPEGTTIRAMEDGIVLHVGYEDPLNHRYGAGLYVLQSVTLPAYDGWTIRYSHLKAAYVATGTILTQFYPLAESGMSGDVQTPYLHVELLDHRQQPRAMIFDE